MLGKSRAETGGGPAERSKDRGLGAFVRRHGLVSFYALAYGMSWLFWLPYVLSQNGLGILDVSFPKILGNTQLAGILPGAYLGPLGAAFVVTALSEGRPGLRRWGGRLFRWGVNWRWYALALLGVPALLVAGTLVVSPGSAAGLRFPPLAALLAYLPFLVLQMLTTGLAEEPGWRDFALVRHQRLHGPLMGTLILGMLWAGWHLPLFLTDWGRENGGRTRATSSRSCSSASCSASSSPGSSTRPGEPPPGHAGPREQQQLRVGAVLRHVHHPEPVRRDPELGGRDRLRRAGPGDRCGDPREARLPARAPRRRTGEGTWRRSRRPRRGRGGGDLPAAREA